MRDEMHLIYDKAEEMRFIRNHISQNIKNKALDDDIIYILTLMRSYFMQNELLADLDVLEEGTMWEINEQELKIDVLWELETTKLVDLTTSEILSIIEADLSYCRTLGLIE